MPLSKPQSHPEAGFSWPVVIGFLLPFACLTLIALALHHNPARAPTISSSNNTPSAAATQPVAANSALPSATEVNTADAAILSYCSSDLRPDEHCSLVSGSDIIAPGFVEVGVNESGQFDPTGATGQGLGLAKGSGTAWSVIWVGQSCIPKDIANQNNVPNSFKICSA